MLKFSLSPLFSSSAASWSGPSAFRLAVVLTVSATPVAVNSAYINSVADAFRCLRQLAKLMLGQNLPMW